MMLHFVGGKSRQRRKKKILHCIVGWETLIHTLLQLKPNCSSYAFMPRHKFLWWVLWRLLHALIEWKWILLHRPLCLIHWNDWWLNNRKHPARVPDDNAFMKAAGERRRPAEALSFSRILFQANYLSKKKCETTQSLYWLETNWNFQKHKCISINCHVGCHDFHLLNTFVALLCKTFSI